MAFLTPDRTRTETLPGGQRVTVCEKLIPDSMVAPKDVASYVKKGWKMKPCLPLGGDGNPRGITVHNTGDIKVAAGTNAAEQYARATLNGNMGGTVVHYYVWHSDVWQLLSESERGWHAADGAARRTDHRGGQTGGNVDTLAVEVIGNDPETVETAQALTAALCLRHGLNPLFDVYTHNYWMYGIDGVKPGANKNCPVYLLPVWADFLKGVQTLTRSGEGTCLFGVPADRADEVRRLLQEKGISTEVWKQTE